MGKGLAEVSESWKKWIIRVSLDTFIHESIGKIEQGKTHLGIVVKHCHCKPRERFVAFRHFKARTRQFLHQKLMLMIGFFHHSKALLPRR